MANYGYITTPRRLTEQEAEALITTAVGACLDPRWVVQAWDGPRWFVFLPGTEKTGRAAVDAVLADGDPVGFMVSLWTDGDVQHIAFPHGPNRFERWAQGRLEEQLADELGVGVLYDATDEIKPPGTCWYRADTTYREHMEHRFAKLSDDDKAYIDRQMYCVPEGHR